MKIDRASLTTLRQCLDQMMYSLMDFRLSVNLEMSSTGFPIIQSLRAAVRQLDPVYQVLFRLFRIGEAVDDESIRHALPANVLEALGDLELLIRDDTGEWRTPSLLIVPAEGLYLLVGIPPNYPTATGPCHTGFDMSSHIVAKSLPASLSGQRVLDICSGSGIQGLLCARRGADSVVGLELNEKAVITARANAVLNDLDQRVEFRQSDKLAALDESERFDFVVCNTPSSPVIDQVSVPSSAAEIGNIVLFGLLEKLPRHLQPDAGGVMAAWRSFGFQSRTFQLEAIAAHFASHGFSTTAFVDQAPNTVESILRTLQTELERRPGMRRTDAAEIMKRLREQLQQREKPIDGAYNQIIFIKREQQASAESAIFPLFTGQSHVSTTVAKPAQASARS
ncbi:MAG TPA: class I SAM-dependent methyltransferase [Pyrinomonadaceae bacterium]|nr:class I SAM-dependent methyltransferase [Pyrinomonadaceae bacterium]